MSVLTRYLLRAHAGPLLFAFVALTGVVLINTLARSMADLVGKGLPTSVFFEFFLLSLPANIALTLPMSVLVAVLYTFSQMAAENEITALRASGIDLRRMVLPLLLVATLITAGMIRFNNEVLPAANYRWRTLMMDVAQTSPLLFIRPQVVNELATGDGSSRFYVQATEVDETDNRLRDVTIHDVSDPGRSRTIYADSARMQQTAAGTDLVLVLFDGHLREMEREDPESFRRMTFQEHVLRVDGVRQALDRSEGESFRTDRDMTTQMMRARIDTLRAELAEARERASVVPPPSAGIPDSVEVQGRHVPFSRAQEEGILFRIRELQVEIQKKYAIASATLVFVLIGVPLALRFPRGGVGMVIAASLAIFSVYYVGLIGGEALGNAGYVPPWLAMWFTNGIFGILGLIGLWRLGGEHSTARGGGWPAWRLRLPFRQRTAPTPVEA
ncbi:MAG TPA: LptF/LptG family permease [Longimicrobiaceae bacterium]